MLNNFFFKIHPGYFIVFPILLLQLKKKEKEAYSMNTVYKAWGHFKHFSFCVVNSTNCRYHVRREGKKNSKADISFLDAELHQKQPAKFHLLKKENRKFYKYFF